MTCGLWGFSFFLFNLWGRGRSCSWPCVPTEPCSLSSVRCFSPWPGDIPSPASVSSCWRPKGGHSASVWGSLSMQLSPSSFSALTLLMLTPGPPAAFSLGGETVTAWVCSPYNIWAAVGFTLPCLLSLMVADCHGLQFSVLSAIGSLIFQFSNCSRQEAYPVCAPLLTGSRSKSSLWFWFLYCDYCRVPASFHVFSDPMDFLLSELSIYLRLFLLLRYTGLFLSTLESFFVYFTDQSFVSLD